MVSGVAGFARRAVFRVYSMFWVEVTEISLTATGPRFVAPRTSSRQWPVAFLRVYSLKTPRAPCAPQGIIHSHPPVSIPSFRTLVASRSCISLRTITTRLPRKAHYTAVSPLEALEARTAVGFRVVSMDFIIDVIVVAVTHKIGCVGSFVKYFPANALRITQLGASELTSLPSEPWFAFRAVVAEDSVLKVIVGVVTRALAAVTAILVLLTFPLSVTDLAIGGGARIFAIGTPRAILVVRVRRVPIPSIQADSTPCGERSVRPGRI